MMVENATSERNATTSGLKVGKWFQRGVVVGIALQIAFWIFFLGSTIVQQGIFNLVASDFGYFWAAANAFMANGPESFYNLEILTSHAEALIPYYGAVGDIRRIGMVVYPPIFIALLIPFTIPSSPVVGYVLWTTVNLALTAYVALRLADRVVVDRIVMIAVVITFFPVVRSLVVGQPGGLLLFALWKGIEALEQGRHGVAGAWLGILLIKPNYLALLVVWLLISRRWQVLAGLSAVGAGLVLSTVAILRWDGTVTFVGAATDFGVRMNQSLPGAAPDMMPSWRGMIANIPVALSEPGSLALFGCLAFLTLAAWSLSFRFEPGSGGGDVSLMMLSTLIVTILVNPLAHIHALILLVAPAVLVAAGSGTSASQVKQSYLASLYLLPTIGILSIAFTGWITWVAIAILGVLVVMFSRILYFQIRERAVRSALASNLIDSTTPSPVSNSG
jgi:hypothetical protein